MVRKADRKETKPQLEILMNINKIIRELSKFQSIGMNNDLLIKLRLENEFLYKQSLYLLSTSIMELSKVYSLIEFANSLYFRNNILKFVERFRLTIESERHIHNVKGNLTTLYHLLSANNTVNVNFLEKLCKDLKDLLNQTDNWNKSMVRQVKSIAGVGVSELRNFMNVYLSQVNNRDTLALDNITLELIDEVERHLYNNSEETLDDFASSFIPNYSDLEKLSDKEKKEILELQGNIKTYIEEQHLTKVKEKQYLSLKGLIHSITNKVLKKKEKINDKTKEVLNDIREMISAILEIQPEDTKGMELMSQIINQMKRITEYGNKVRNQNKNKKS